MDGRADGWGAVIGGWVWVGVGGRVLVWVGECGW
jgi:hypothetical protein